MCNNEYNTCLMQGTQFYRKFTITDESFKFTDYEVKMEIRDTLYGDTILTLQDADFTKTDTTLEFSIDASDTINFPIKILNYGISLTDKNDAENVKSFLIGTITISVQIPQIPREVE